jgi:DNA-directed RNA polymerase sigma subunit (sigma70/sigma32)
MNSLKPISKSQNSDGQTLHEIAEAFNLTRERVRQIEAKVLVKLRRKLQKDNLKLNDILDI